MNLEATEGTRPEAPGSTLPETSTPRPLVLVCAAYTKLATIWTIQETQQTDVYNPESSKSASKAIKYRKGPLCHTANEVPLRG